MKRLIAASLLALAVAAPASAGPGVPQPGGICEDPIDYMCRERPCGEDELDCGMILPCVVWINGSCFRLG